MDSDRALRAIGSRLRGAVMRVVQAELGWVCSMCLSRIHWLWDK